MTYFNNAPEDPATARKLAAITDPADRAEKAAEIASAARTEVYEIRDPRNIALAILHLRHGRNKTPLYEMADMNKSTFDDLLDRLPATIAADPADVDWDAVDQDDLHRMYLHMLDLTVEEVEQIAESKCKRYNKQFSIWATAGKVRDQLALELMDGVHGAAWSNADVARLCKLSTPKITRIRNRGRAARAAAA